MKNLFLLKLDNAFTESPKECTKHAAAMLAGDELDRNGNQIPIMTDPHVMKSCAAES